MQYIVSTLLQFHIHPSILSIIQFIHRVVQHFIRPSVDVPQGFEHDYVRWLDERSQRLFVDDLENEVVLGQFLTIILSLNNKIPAFRLLSPKVDPDLLPLVRHRERPELRREIHAHVGELPLPSELEIRQQPEQNPLATVQLPKRYPRGKRY
jgi:hypothetical protein